MLIRTTCITSLLLILILGLVLYITIIPLSGTSLSERSGKNNTEQQEGELSVQQLRYEVSKDLWVHDPEMGRLHHHIDSPSSTLTAQKVGKDIRVVEQMISMKCCVQERVQVKDGELMQQIRYIESPKSNYQYFDHHFNAQSVFLALLHLPGDTPFTELDLDHAFLTGVAKELSLYLLKDKIHCQSQKFKAHIRMQNNAL